MYSYVSPALLLTVTFVLLCTRPKWPGVPPNQMYKILETPSRLRVLPSIVMPLLCVALCKFKQVFCTLYNESSRGTHSDHLPEREEWHGTELEPPNHIYISRPAARPFLVFIPLHPDHRPPREWSTQVFTPKAVVLLLLLTLNIFI